MARPLNGAITGLAGICALVSALAAVDERVRGQLVALASGRAPSGELVSAGERVHDVATTIMLAARDQSIEHAALTIFALSALVLLLFMMRT